VGRDRLPSPTTMGVMNRWHSSTNPALNAWAARSGRPRRCRVPLAFSADGTRRDRSPARSASWRWRPPPAYLSTRSCRQPAISGRSPARRTVGKGVRGLPVAHQLVHPAPVEVRADLRLEVVDESVHLLVRRGPLEVTVSVGIIAVERRDGRVDQVCYSKLPLPLDIRTYLKKDSGALLGSKQEMPEGASRCHAPGTGCL
jgi:hypothetical protein